MTSARLPIAAAIGAIAFACASLRGAAADPPQGIEPTTASLSSVLSAYRRAQGAPPRGKHDTRIFHWSVTFGGLSGTQTEVRFGHDDRIDTALGPMHTASGTLAGRGWSMNENGEVVIAQGVHHAEALDRAAFRSATGSTSAVTLVGQMDRPLDAYVVKVDPPGGVREYLYIDRVTSLLDARVLRYPDRSVLMVYDDYRPTLSLQIAWHIHESIDNGREEEDFRLHDVALGAPVDPSELAIPASTSIVAFVAPRTMLPGKIINDRVILPVQMSGRVVNLQLDSGASGIALDRGIVRALGYPQYGRVIGKTAGTYVESTALVPSMTIGSLTMQNVYVRSLPFEELADAHTPVGGLLGFDFIDSVVVHVDYADGTVEAIDPRSFTVPADAVSIPIALDDEIPAIAARIGPAVGLRFLVDTGADRSILFSAFATAHADAMRDCGLGTQIEAAFPFLGNFQGVGGSVSYRPVELGPLTVAQWTFPSWLFDLTQDSKTFDIEDYDGILGQDILRYYDLYLDYQHDRILLAPNARYAERFSE